MGGGDWGALWVSELCVGWTYPGEIGVPPGVEGAGFVLALSWLKGLSWGRGALSPEVGAIRKMLPALWVGH